MSISTINNTNINLDLKANDQTGTNPIIKKSNQKKLCILVGIISAIVLITTIVLLAVFLPNKKKKSPRSYSIPSLESNDYHQTIELLIDGKEVGKRRYLQEEENVQILGKNFNELNSKNTIIYLDDKKVTFAKYLPIKSNSIVKVYIKFFEKIKTFKEMFSGCNRIKEISLIDVETDFISETTSMFENCSSLSRITFKNMSIYNITSTSKMFKKCTSLKTIDIEGLSTTKTKDMSKMFEGCSSLNDTSFMESLSTNNAEFLNEMFSGCSSIKILRLSGYDTSNAKNMSGMFKCMTNLEELKINSFHTEKVQKMSEMFENCKSISSLDLSNFNTEMVINMDRMFTNCSKLNELDVSSFKLTRCNSTEYMFSNTTRELMLSIEKNDELMKSAGISWSENNNEESNITKIPLDILFLVDATGSMSKEIESVKENIIYIAVNLLKYKTMRKYDLSLGALFYRDPISSYRDIHEIFDFNKNALNFKNFVSNISAYGGGDGPEDWAGAFNLAKNLSWENNATKFIIHIADAPAHGYDWCRSYSYNAEGKKTDEVITYFAKNNFSIAGFEVYDLDPTLSISFLRAQELFRNNSNKNYFITEFSAYETDKNYFLNLVYVSFQNIFVDIPEVIKKEVWEWYETKVGAHYYAYSPYTSGYSKVKSFIKLPDELNTNHGSRNAYISFGVSGEYYSIDTGIRNNETYGWCPYYYDVNHSDFRVFDAKCAPLNTSIVEIETEVTLERMVIFSIKYKDSNLNELDSFEHQINASNILLLDTNNKPINRFYRFASLVNVIKNKDDQNDNTYMYGGEFTNLTIFRDDDVNYPWGISSDYIEASWKVSYKRIQVNYTDNSDSFAIYHKLPEDD